MLSPERTRQLRAAIATLKAEGKKPSYHAIQGLVRGKYATLCKDLRELAGADAQGTAEPRAETGDTAPGAPVGPAAPPLCQTPQAQLAQAEAAFAVAMAALTAAQADVEVAAQAVQAAQAAAAQAAELARLHWANMHYPELFMAHLTAKRALEVLREGAAASGRRDGWREDQAYMRVAELEKRIRTAVAEAPAVV